MAFDAYDVSLDLIRTLRLPLEPLTARDPDLARQLRRAASSVAQNLREGRRRAGKDRAHHFRIAAGSADEVVACLQVAEAWGHVQPADVAPSLVLADRVLAMTWRLTH
jgi:four helix bundle protein